MTQVYGRKRVKMVCSDALHLVYNFESFFSEVDAEEPDLGRYPRFADAEIIDVLLRARRRIANTGRLVASRTIVRHQHKCFAYKFFVSE